LRETFSCVDLRSRLHDAAHPTRRATDLIAMTTHDTICVMQATVDQESGRSARLSLCWVKHVPMGRGMLRGVAQSVMFVTEPCVDLHFLVTSRARAGPLFVLRLKVRPGDDSHEYTTEGATVVHDYDHVPLRPNFVVEYQKPSEASRLFIITAKSSGRLVRGELIDVFSVLPPPARGLSMVATYPAQGVHAGRGASGDVSLVQSSRRALLALKRYRDPLRQSSGCGDAFCNHLFASAATRGPTLTSGSTAVFNCLHEAFVLSILPKHPLLVSIAHSQALTARSYTEPDRDRSLRGAMPCRPSHHHCLQQRPTESPSQLSPQIWMQAVLGGSLDGFLRDECPIDPEPTFEDAELYCILMQGLCALNVIAAAGVVHRDVKPENLLLHDRVPTLSDSSASRTQRVSMVLCDFGAAILLTHDGEPAHRTPVGTPGFLPPEVLLQWGVRSTGMPNTVPYTPRSDVFSLGTIFYKYVTMGSCTGLNDAEDYNVAAGQYPSLLATKHLSLNDIDALNLNELQSYGAHQAYSRLTREDGGPEGRGTQGRVIVSGVTAPTNVVPLRELRAALVAVRERLQTFDDVTLALIDRTVTWDVGMRPDAQSLLQDYHVPHKSMSLWTPFAQSIGRQNVMPLCEGESGMVPVQHAPRCQGSYTTYFAPLSSCSGGAVPPTQVDDHGPLWILAQTTALFRRGKRSRSELDRFARALHTHAKHCRPLVATHTVITHDEVESTCSAVFCSWSLVTSPLAPNRLFVIRPLPLPYFLHAYRNLYRARQAPLGLPPRAIVATLRRLIEFRIAQWNKLFIPARRRIPVDADGQPLRKDGPVAKKLLKAPLSCPIGCRKGPVAFSVDDIICVVVKRDGTRQSAAHAVDHGDDEMDATCQRRNRGFKSKLGATVAPVVPGVIDWVKLKQEVTQTFTRFSVWCSED